MSFRGRDVIGRILGSLPFHQSVVPFLKGSMKVSHPGAYEQSTEHGCSQVASDRTIAKGEKDCRVTAGVACQVFLEHREVARLQGVWVDLKGSCLLFTVYKNPTSQIRPQSGALGRHEIWGTCFAHHGVEIK